MTELKPPAGDIVLHELNAMSQKRRSALLTRTEDDLDRFIEGASPIVEAVRINGDDAIKHYATAFDDADLEKHGIAASPSEFDAAFDTLEPDLIRTIEYAADNIRRFHEAQRPEAMWLKEIQPGVLVGERFTPIDSAAVYTPRGKGSFPSVTLMTAIPAVVAGVPTPIVLTPPGPDGKVDAATLVAARIAGIDRVYKAGGAVAVAAVAFGTQTVPRCLKFEGPGSPWIVAAKRLLQGKIASRVPAGPSESIVLADGTVEAGTVALDLLIEAEHGADSSAFLVTWSRDLAESVRQKIPQFLKMMDARRAGFAKSVLSGAQGGIVLADSPQQAYDFVNAYAPEHLQILSETPFDHMPHIRNAAEILLGRHAPGSIANYVMGPNAVLPTAGAARYASPLGVHDFLKSASIGHVTAEGFSSMAPYAKRFAEYEGFDAHANAVSELRQTAGYAN